MAPHRVRCVRVGTPTGASPVLLAPYPGQPIRETDGRTPARTVRLTMHGSATPAPQEWRASLLPSSSRSHVLG